MTKTKEKLTRRKTLLKGFAKEERQTYKLYKNLGFRKQGREELSHAIFFEKELKKLQKKTKMGGK